MNLSGVRTRFCLCENKQKNIRVIFIAICFRMEVLNTFEPIDRWREFSLLIGLDSFSNPAAQTIVPNLMVYINKLALFSFQ